MAVLAGVGADIYLSATPSIALVAAEACDNVDSGAWVRYRAHTHFYWDKTATFTVQTSTSGSGPWTTVTNYNVEWAGGYIVFNSTLGANHFVQILAGSYFNVTQAAYANKWELSQKAEQTDTTVFGSTQAFHTRTPTLKSGTVKFSSFDADATYQTLLNNLAVVVCYTSVATNLRWESYAYMTQDSFNAVVTSVGTHDVSFDVEGNIYYRTAA